MTALEEAYEAKRKDGDIVSCLIYKDQDIWKGAIVCVLYTDGYLRPGANTANFVTMGVAVENSEAVADEDSGDRSVRVYRTGTFKVAASGATQAWVGRQVYVADDNTVALRGAATVTQGILAGICIEYIDSTHVRVDVRCTTQATWAEESWSSSSSSSSSTSFSSSSSSSV